MRNPLNNSNGKSDVARNCYTKKFRKGWELIFKKKRKKK